MTIDAYIRTATNQYLRNLIIKDKCEMCGCSNTEENLILHHVKPFALILKNCLKSLGYEYHKECESYTKNQIDHIEHYMLGAQLKVKYLTLCTACHVKVHSSNGGFFRTTDRHEQYYIDMAKRKEIEREDYTKNVVVPYLDSILGKRIFRDDGGVEELYNIVDYKVDGKTQKSYRKLNYSFKEVFDIPYTIIAKKTNKKRYWIVERVQ